LPDKGLAMYSAFQQRCGLCYDDSTATECNLDRRLTTTLRCERSERHG
jgi:hypothetical protein